MSKLKYELAYDAFDIMQWERKITHAHDNQRELVVSLGTVSWDKLSNKSVVIVMEVAAKLEPAKDYKRLALSPRQWKNQALAAIHSQTLPAKNTLKYY